MCSRGRHFLCTFKYGPVGICNFCLDRGKAILVITDPQDHFFSQSLFKFKNRGVGIFIPQSGVSESPFYSFGNYGCTFSLI